MIDGSTPGLGGIGIASTNSGDTIPKNISRPEKISVEMRAHR
jgi:hypothetical protein